MNHDQSPIPGFAVIDLMGHIRYAGYVSEELVAGVPMLRIAVPVGENTWEVTYQSPASLYAIRPCTEDLARLLAAKHPLPAADAWDLSDELRQKITQVEQLEREGQLPPQYPQRSGRYIDYANFDDEDPAYDDDDLDSDEE